MSLPYTHSSQHQTFWDGLSKVSLELSALVELNRRNRAQPALSPPLLSPDGLTRDLARFARHGGPDLRGLRGDFASAIPSQSASPIIATAPGTGIIKIRKSSPYGPEFNQHLIDHGVHTTWKSQKIDLEQVRAALVVPRPSLSLSNFSESAFEVFQEINAQANDKRDVLENVFPSINGPLEDNYPSTKNIIFGNLKLLTDQTIMAPKPDIALGALPEQLDPIVKGPEGSAAVMLRQARYDGAVGTRAMHSLQNYGREHPVYDGKAYTYSSTYHGGTGTLHLYAHHSTVPTTPGGQPEYHVNQLRAYALTSDRETFVQGTTAYRNLRDLAKQHRDTFIRDANFRR
ncbi:hypothetical protein F5883DRAFT_605457 [Diaporthe sp. PMI_573]|nr:hypothetical protein F5883DRAFT_605457 [Diaporthaceae sp. PMI_573]